MGFKNVFSPSGGIYYHLSALKYRRRLWQDFADELEKVLLSWPQKNKTLTIFGASGGYCLKESFLNRYDNIEVYDPDPLAALIFKSRFILPTRWHSEDLLQKNGIKGDVKGLLQLIQQRQTSDLLFSNFLGQLPLIIDCTDQVQQDLKEVLREIFQCMNAFSYHDLYSYNEFAKHEHTDHLTRDLFPFAKHKSELVWRIKPYRTHVIETAF